MQLLSKSILLPSVLVLSLGAWMSLARPHRARFFLIEKESFTPEDSTVKQPKRKKTQPNYTPRDRMGDMYSEDPARQSPFELKDPDNIKQDVELDPSLEHYNINEKAGDVDYRAPSEVSFEEFYKMKNQEMLKNYWNNKTSGPVGQATNKNQGPFSLKIPIRGLEGPFGSNFVDIRPNGLVTLDFGGKWQRVYNPALTIRQQKNGVFDFDQQITMNVVGKIGEKLRITANWDTKAAFEFQNNIKVQYTAFEEDIIQGVEVGRVSMPLNSSLINGAQNLFGIKTKLKFGRLTVTSVLARQDGKVDEMVIQGGSQGRSFEIKGHNYEEYKHFFLSHFFRENYERSMKSLPIINSGVRVTRVEVYVTNRSNMTENLRDVVAYLDLGETSRIHNTARVTPIAPLGDPADNKANTLYNEVINLSRNSDALSGILTGIGYTNGTDYAILKSAKKLTERDFTFHPDLGYISLQTPIRSDEVLAVSYEYAYQGKIYKVGETTEDYQDLQAKDAIALKMLKPFTIKLNLPSWDLMMKNIYNIGATQLSRENFQLRVIYKDDLSGVDIPNLQEGIRTKNVPLLQLSGLDNLNPNNDPSPDGNFDYIETVTVDSRNGRIIFPVVEPFGSNLEKQFDVTESDLKNKYVFNDLYRSTKNFAEQQASYNKFFLKGRYQASSTSEIILPGINIAPGSVNVIVGSNQLQEGTDFTIDYTIGRLKIINEGALSSGQEIRIRFEKQDLFNFRRKSFYGTRLDYQINKDFLIGGTLLQQNEAPQISRVNIGDEPSKNTVWGLDMNYSSESRRLTKLVDKIPFIDTKAPSQVNFQGEFAQMIPGHNKRINQDGSRGIAFIDDFEGSKTSYDLSKTPIRWKIAATPQRFPESSQSGLPFAYRRAKLAWYNIDNVFYRTNGVDGFPVPPEDQNHFERAIFPREIFPGQDLQAVNINLSTLDLAYYPSERGPYNFNTDLNNNGTLKTPANNWAGVSRSITNDIDFDNANIQYIEFWMMSPYDLTPARTTIDGAPFDNNNRGRLYFNLGDISEDVMKDGKHAFENGLPVNDELIPTQSTNTAWGRVTNQQFLTDAFDNDPSSRGRQDVGLDGLNNSDELSNPAFASFVNTIQSSALPSATKEQIFADPAADDFGYYLSTGGPILQRYKNFNGLENNSPINSGGEFTPSNSNFPDNEDLNQDNTINDLEEYYEYAVDIDPARLEVGQNYIVSKRTQTINGDQVNWYQVRIPIRDPSATVVGNISGFKSIRFMRMYMTGFESPVVLRMAQLQLVANQWRVYQSDDINESGFGTSQEPDDAIIDVSTVNVEENGQGDANTSPYVLPPGFIRDQDITSTVNRRLNEQSIRLCVESLNDRNARAVFKNVNYDFLNYGRIRMFIHAESNDPTISDGKVTAFLRLGTDFKDNYYDIEVPLYFTNPKNTFDPYSIWRGENEINLLLEELVNTKLERDRAGTALTSAYSRWFDGKKLTVVGKPDLTAVVTVMLGLKNPGDDNLPHSFCIWANELRVTDFNEKSSWAATGKLNLKLADFGNVTATARYIGAGFGSLEQKVSQRKRTDNLEWGVAGNFDMHKFLPMKLGLRLPMYVGYNRSVITPRYDPLNPDVLLKKQLANMPEENRDDYKKLVVDQTTTKAINFTNIKKVKVNPNSKKRIYDIENLSLTLGYTETKRTSYDIKDYTYKYYKGALGYDYTANPKSYEPFKDSELFKGKYAKLIKDFNFTPLPNMFTFRTDVDRKTIKTEYFESGPLSRAQTPLYEKSFTLSRIYGTSWNMTKNLTVNYKANAFAMIDEPIGAPGGKDYNRELYKSLPFGRLKNYDQTTDINYKLPLDKIPFTDWLSSEYRYAAGYMWTAGPLGITDTLGNSFGNVVQNKRDQTINGKIDLNKLYNKNKFLSSINNPKPKRANAKPDPKDTTVAKKENKVLKSALRTVMLIKSVNLTYTVAEGTQLPGYLNTPSMFGIDNADNAGALLPFVLGSQNPDIRYTAAESGWLSKSRSLNNPFTQFRNQTLNARTSLEPTKDLRIQLDAKLAKGSTYQELFRVDTIYSDDYASENPLRTGNHSVSTITILTAFEGKSSGSPDPNSSKTFDRFLANREDVAARVGTNNLNSQDVMIPAFLAAYKGKKDGGKSVNLNNMPNVPLPNWRVDFTGLTKIPALKKSFESITLSHGYASTYTVGNYTSSLKYNSDYIKPGKDFLSNTPYGDSLNNSGEAIPVYIINEVNIREAFSPLIGINIRTKGKWTYRAEYRRARNLSLSLTNGQLRDETNQDFVFGIGFIKTGVKIPKIFTGGRTKTLKNELNVRMDFTIRDTKGVQRKVDDAATVTSGSINWQIKPTITYNLSSRVSIQIYFERTSNNPKISSSFKRTTTAAGLQLRFTLS